MNVRLAAGSVISGTDGRCDRFWVPHILRRLLRLDLDAKPESSVPQA